MADTDRYEVRSQKVADALRALLTALATAGIGAVYAMHGQTTVWGAWFFSGLLFLVSLGCVLRSWFVAKHRELRRREASRANQPQPEFTKWSRKSSWLWDTLAAWTLFIGAALLSVAVWVPSGKSCYEAAKAFAEVSDKTTAASGTAQADEWVDAYLAAQHWKRQVCP